MFISPGGSLGGIIGASRSYLPTNDGSDLAFWYEAEQYSGTSLVAQWDDLSGNDRHLVQATSGSRPTYSATSFNGSKPGIFFTVDDFMGTATSFDLNTYKVIFIVANFGVGNAGILLEHGTNGFGSGGAFITNPASNANGQWLVNNGTTAAGPQQYANAGSGGTASGNQNYSFEYTASGGVVKLAGTAISPAPTLTGGLLSNTTQTRQLYVGARLGGAFPATFTAAAIYCLNRSVTAQDFTNFAAYAATRY